MFISIVSALPHLHFTHNIRRQYLQYFSAFYNFLYLHTCKSTFFQRPVIIAQIFWGREGVWWTFGYDSDYVHSAAPISPSKTACLDPRAIAVSRYGWLKTSYGWLAG